MLLVVRRGVYRKYPKDHILSAIKEYRESKKDPINTCSLNSIAIKHNIPWTTLKTHVNRDEGQEIRRSGPEPGRVRQGAGYFVGALGRRHELSYIMPPPLDVIVNCKQGAYASTYTRVSWHTLPGKLAITGLADL